MCVPAMNATETRYWESVLSRDRQADGHFVYAVRSTGIYCRPSCPSRRPSADQVEFFTAPTQAEQAGYRACRRCQPDQITPEQIAWVQRVCDLIREAPDGTLALAELSQTLNVSPSHLQKVFRQVMGITPRAYAEALRVERLKRNLRTGSDVTRAALDAGYGSLSQVYESDGIGMTPAAYRKGGAGLRITFATAVCPLGMLLVAATGRGICSVALGDSADRLEQALRDEFPAAEVVRDTEGVLQGWVDELLAYLGGQGPLRQLPLDLQATAFQQRVWQELRQIPYGSTLTYGEVAERIGQPDAARAVANACASNPVSMLIPCHRVVPASGGTGGYRWGSERKRALLAGEKRQS
jgi:AraC family transcriptional regulator of adaptative response/methylated-DNA-[protein]-cysteine methyltransferase